MRILITPLIAGKPFNGATIYEEGLGGSEACVVYLARELGRRGHGVVVYTHGQPGTFENVMYRDVQELNQGIPTSDIHISSRWIDILRHPSPAKKILWLHDLPNQTFTELPADAVVAISQFQAGPWGLNMDDPAVHIIGDGVDITNFKGREVRDRNRLIWASNPDRGLYVASEILVKELIPRWPDLQLHVYGRAAVYGWAPSAEMYYLPPKKYIDAGYVVLHEPLPRLSLARELMKSWAMFYPTTWPETFCMAALESQAAGTPVIAPPYGALTETVKGGILTDDYINAVSQLRNVNRWNKLSEAGKVQAEDHSWSKIAMRWESVMEGLVS